MQDEQLSHIIQSQIVRKWTGYYTCKQIIKRGSENKSLSFAKLKYNTVRYRAQSRSVHPPSEVSCLCHPGVGWAARERCWHPPPIVGRCFCNLGAESPLATPVPPGCQVCGRCGTVGQFQSHPGREPWWWAETGKSRGSVQIKVQHKQTITTLWDEWDN